MNDWEYEFIDNEAICFCKELNDINNIVKTTYGIKSEGDSELLNNLVGYYVIHHTTDSTGIIVCSSYTLGFQKFNLKFQEPSKRKKKIETSNIIFNMINDKNTYFRFPVHCIDYFRFYKEYANSIIRVNITSKYILISTNIPDISFKISFFDQLESVFNAYIKLLNSIENETCKNKNLLLEQILTDDKNKEIFESLINTKNIITLLLPNSDESIEILDNTENACNIDDERIKFTFNIDFIPKYKKGSDIKLSVYSKNESEDIVIIKVNSETDLLYSISYFTIANF